MKIPECVFTDGLVYVIGERCPCTDPACHLTQYQAAVLLKRVRIFMGRN